MKTKIYILTYKGFNRLNKTLKSVFESDYADNECEINIINNHTEIRIDEQYIKRVNILNNNLQADFSTGHMSRNWNQALILGFENLNNPKSDLVITLQDDVILHNQWYNKLINLHNKYINTLITYIVDTDIPHLVERYLFVLFNSEVDNALL